PRIEEGILEFDDKWTTSNFEGVSGEFFELSRVIDYDGDGRDDLITAVNTDDERQWYLVQPEGPHNSASSVVNFRGTPIDGLPTSSAWLEDGSPPMFADFNADGAVDALFFRRSELGGSFLIRWGQTPD